jgi:hypothetical protein
MHCHASVYLPCKKLGGGDLINDDEAGAAGGAARISLGAGKFPRRQAHPHWRGEDFAP